MKKFPLVYKQPERGSAPVAHDRVASHQAVFANMSNMVPFVRVLNAFTKDCPYLDCANEIVNTLQKGMFNDSIPARIDATGVQGIRKGEDDNPLLKSASGPSDIMGDLMMGAHQNHYGTKRDRDESSDIDVVPTDSTRVNFELAVSSELSAPAHGNGCSGWNS